MSSWKRDSNMRVSQRSRLGAIAVLAVIAVAGFCLARYLYGKGLVWAVSFSTVATAVLAAIALLMPLFRRLIHTLSGPTALPRSSIPQARDDLAVALTREWAEEERLRQINDPRPLPVSWEVTSSAGAATATSANVVATDLAGEFETILSLFSRLSPPRLVILGRAGAGKSILVIKLARELLAARQADMRVPVILPAAAWDLDADLPEWIADQLCRNHPGLAHPVKDVTGKVTTLAFSLATDNMVLPIIDGLDELSEGQQAKGIDKINKFGSDAPLVLTCRTEEFLAAIAAVGRGVTRAAVVELLPLEVRQVEQYLIEATTVAPAGRWDSVFARLNSEPDGPLAHVLCTPLNLWLARTVYESSGEPGELANQTRFGDVQGLEDHLLDAFIPAVYAGTTGNRRFHYQPQKAEGWLGFLAAQLDRIRQPDFAWWRLIRATPGWNVICVGLRTVLLCNALWAVTNWILTRHGYWDNGSYVSHAAWHSILSGGPLGRLAWPALDRLLAFRSQQIHHDLNISNLLKHLSFLPWTSFPGFEIALAGLGIILGIMNETNELAAASDKNLPRRLRVRPFSIVRSAASNAIGRAVVASLLTASAMWLLRPTGAGAVFPPGFLNQWSTLRALLAVAATGATVISVSSLVQPLDVSRSTSPDDALHFDQRAAWSVWALRQVMGTAVAWLWAGPEVAAAYGLLAVIAALVRLVLGGPSWAAQTYSQARIWLFARGRVPWRTLRFLSDAHRRGVLRQTGALYQFRHIRLQERLAAAHPLTITRMDRWARRELLARSLRILSIAGEDQIRAADDENARQQGWVVTVAPGDLCKYRDPRFDNLPTIKLLFATARTCAYPGCQVPLVFEDAESGSRSVALKIAHIQSPEATGPRPGPEYPAEQLNSEENLLLLCRKHHRRVEGHESKYTIEQLLDWKKVQVGENGGFVVRDGDIGSAAPAPQASVDELVQATRLQLQVRLVGGRVGLRIPAVARMNLDGLDKVGSAMGHLFRPGRLIGVEVENRGIEGAEVQAAGIDIDFGPGESGPWQYPYAANGITRWKFPCRVDGHATRFWFETEDRIREFLDRLYAARGLAPQRFRPWASLGNGDRLCGEWTARTDLPIWEPFFGGAYLRYRFGDFRLTKHGTAQAAAR
jgi:hypothetical protein